MNIGIIVYSQTGNTLSVAQKLAQALRAKGHRVSIASVESIHNDPSSPGSNKLKSGPDVSPYDIIIFSAPVQAFGLAPVMKQYLAQISSLAGKKVFCFVTQQFKMAWLGGNRAVGQIKSACKKKGAEITLSGIVHWSSAARDQQIDDVVRRFSEI